MRAVLVVNPAATTTSPRTRDVLVAALGSDLKLDVAVTSERGHAVDLARRARRDGMDLVIALGGDGTVNEVVNGLLADGGTPVAEVPALGVVPGGSTNVFARSLGLPGNAVEATGVLLDAVRRGRRRRIGLGRAEDRWFTFTVGLGLDAEVVAAVERRRSKGRSARPALFLSAALHHFFTVADRRTPALVLMRRGAEPVTGIYFAVVANTDPWTYLGSRPVHPSPNASFDTGLDLFALRHLGTVTTLRHLRQILSPSRRPPHGRHVVSVHDADALVLEATRPVALQVDGEALAPVTRLRLEAVPSALDVLA